MHTEITGAHIMRRTVCAIRPLLSSGLLLLTQVFASAQIAAPQYFFSHLAGALGGPGSTDGIGSAARFTNPFGTAVDSAGNIYVADTDNSTIRKITPGGVVTTLAGMAGVLSSADGTGPAARFNSPSGVAVDSAGTVYVADTGNNTIRKVTAGGAVTTLAGMAGVHGSADGIGPGAQFYRPQGVAVDGAGTVYVADSKNGTIRKITPGGVVTTLAGTAGIYGSADGAGPAAQFSIPSGVAVDSAGSVYVADELACTIRKITPGGVVTTLAGTAGVLGSADGIGPAAQFYIPEGVAVDSAGTIYVADGNNNTIRKITPGGVVTTLAGTGGVLGSADGIGPAAQFGEPHGVAVDSAGTLYVAERYNCTIRKVTPGGVVTTLAGMAGGHGSTDATRTAARFEYPLGVAMDGAGTIYVADSNNGAIRKINPDGMVTTLAGTAGVLGSADGTGPSARFTFPLGIAVNNVGTVYVADVGNHTIRKITAGGVVTTLAGMAGVTGSTDGTGSAARFYSPQGVAVDGADMVYVADAANGTIRKITPGGVVTTLAGTARVLGSADGTGPAAKFLTTVGVAVDSAGTVYVTDSDNRTIRKITPSGVVTTLAGTPGVKGTVDGTGPAAQFNSPYGVAVDSAGNVYVADILDYTIRKITPGGVVTTLAGTPGVKGSSDGIGLAAQFYNPAGLVVDSVGAIYVADSANNTIRKGQLAGQPIITTQPQSQTVAPGANVQFSVTAGAVPAPTYQWYFNGSVFNGGTASTLSFTSARSADAGDYTVVVTNQLGSVTSSKATLTVSAATVTPPTPSTPSSGGGSIEGWFALGLFSLVGLSNCARRRPLSTVL